MDFTSRERLGIFLIFIAVWYLVNMIILNALNPILAIPGSIIFITGLWLLLSLPIPTTETSTYFPMEFPEQAAIEPAAEPIPIPVSKSRRKPTKKSKSSRIKD